MKVLLKRNKDNKSCGWTLEAENEEDKLILGTIRQHEFWGTDGDKPKYDGITMEGNYVTTLSYKIPNLVDVPEQHEPTPDEHSHHGC